MFIVAAIVFPQSVYSNVKSRYTDAIQNNNKRRFAIYLKTENGGFSEKEIYRQVFETHDLFTREQMTAYMNSYR